MYNLPIVQFNNGLWFWRRKREDGRFYHSRTISVRWMGVWRTNGVGAQWGLRTNGAKKGDSCLDASLMLGYLVLNYVDWDYDK